MNQIKDFFKTAPRTTIPHGENYNSATINYIGVNINIDIDETQYQERQNNQSTAGLRLVQLKVGDIIFNSQNPREAKVIHSLPKGKVYANMAQYVLRNRDDLTEGTKLLPTWAIVVMTRRHGHNWADGSRGTLRSGQNLLTHKFDVIPDSNPIGDKILKRMENLIKLRAEANRLMEQLHLALAQQMLRNEPITKKTVEALTLPC